MLFYHVHKFQPRNHMACSRTAMIIISELTGYSHFRSVSDQKYHPLFQPATPIWRINPSWCNLRVLSWSMYPSTYTFYPINKGTQHSKLACHITWPAGKCRPDTTSLYPRQSKTAKIPYLFTIIVTKLTRLTWIPYLPSFFITVVAICLVNPYYYPLF